MICKHGVVTGPLSACVECGFEEALKLQAIYSADKTSVPSPPRNAALTCAQTAARLREIEALTQRLPKNMGAAELRDLLVTTGQLVGKIAAVFEASARTSGEEN